MMIKSNMSRRRTSLLALHPPRRRAPGANRIQFRRLTSPPRSSQHLPRSLEAIAERRKNRRQTESLSAEAPTDDSLSGWQFNRFFDRLNHGLNHGLNHLISVTDALGHDLGGQKTY